MSSESPHNRFSVVGIVAVALFATLFARLWFLQVMTAPEYQVAAENNRIRVVQQEAPRGRILDRTGRHVLVDNRRAIVVTVDWQRYDKLDEADQNAVLSKLAGVLTRDQMRRAAGEVASMDPGGLSVGVTTTTAATGGARSTEPSTTAPSTTATTTPPDGTAPVNTPTPEPYTVDRLKKRLADPRFSHFKPVPVATDVSEDLEVYLAEHAEEFDAVAAQRITVRSYPYGRLLAHVLGYVGAINEDELKAFQNATKPYERDDQIGKTGIERAFESQLRGVPGIVRYEVDARNRQVRNVPGGREPVPGNDVYLSIDINLQFLAEKSLAAQIEATVGRRCRPEGCPDPKSGSVVVLEPGTGRVLAMASYPTYDPGVFVGGIGTEEYAALISEAASVPAENKAIAGQYAPGSTWKLFSAHAGLTNGVIAPQNQVNDPGFYAIPGCIGDECEKQNADRAPHGLVDLSSGLTVSSDVYYYKLGDDMWRRRGTVGDDALGRTYGQWGFGARTGIGVIGESDGRVPTPAWKKEFAARLYSGDRKKVADYGSWYAGDNMNTSIGQGDVLVTPLQLANGYATFANGGTEFVPQLVLQVNKAYSDVVVKTFKPKAARRVDLRPEWRLPILEGLMGVTVSGTAATTFEGFDQSAFAVAGKTGTAQVNDKIDTSLFAAFAPATAPRFTAAAILPEAGNGGEAAAPLIRRILEPIAAGGGTLDGLPEAPLGGLFDVASVLAETIAPPSGNGD